MTIAARTMQAESSMTTMPPVPSSVPAFCSESWSMRTSIWSAVSTGIDTPPGMIAFIGAPFADAAGMLLDDLAQRRAERQLVHARDGSRGR